MKFWKRLLLLLLVAYALTPTLSVKASQTSPNQTVTINGVIGPIANVKPEIEGQYETPDKNEELTVYTTIKPTGTLPKTGFVDSLLLFLSGFIAVLCGLVWIGVKKANLKTVR